MGGIYHLQKIMPKPFSERFEISKSILTGEKDPSLRVEALWILADTLPEIPLNDSLRDEIAEILEFVLLNDENAVVKHEACYLIGENNLKSKISCLQHAAINDPSPLVRHESIEALGLMQEFGSENVIRKALEDSNPSVSQTAEIVLKQFERAKCIDQQKQLTITK